MTYWYRMIHASGAESHWYKNRCTLDMVLGLLRNGYALDSRDSPGLRYELASGDSPRYRLPVGVVYMDTVGLVFAQTDGPTFPLEKT